jgi:hypothetical protein
LPPARSPRGAGKIPSEPDLIVVYGCKAWGANSTCADVHPNGPIPDGSRHCCGSCHKSGIEWHPALQPTALDRKYRRTFPEAEPVPTIYTGDSQRGGCGATKPKQISGQQRKRVKRWTLWSALIKAGWTIREIAEKFGTRERFVKHGIERVKCGA